MRADNLSTTNCVLSEKLMFLNIHDRSDFVQNEKRVRFRLSPDPMEVELIDAVNSLTLGKETATEENNFIIPSNVISDIFRDACELEFVQTVENSQQQQQQNLPKQSEVVEVKEKKSVKRDVSSSPCEGDLVSDSEIKDMDVILMRGNHSGKRLGNSFYRDLIVARKGLYDASDKKTKTRLTWEVLHEMQRVGGRFFIPDKKTQKYSQLQPKLARRKVAQAFRDTHRFSKNQSLTCC